MILKTFKQLSKQCYNFIVLKFIAWKISRKLKGMGYKSVKVTTYTEKQFKKLAQEGHFKDIEVISEFEKHEKNLFNGKDYKDKLN